MRIIGGVLKGKKIIEAFDKNTRPLKDLVKESIFNILEHSKNEKISLNNSVILDLFAGTGSFGLECISRGASKVYFFENYKQSLDILKKNIKKLNCEKKSKVYDENAYTFFEKKEIHREKFDLVFLDPPYREDNLSHLVKNIFKIKILKEDGMIVLHRHKKSKDNLGKEFAVKRSIKYGVSKIIFGKSK